MSELPPPRPSEFSGRATGATPAEGAAAPAAAAEGSATITPKAADRRDESCLARLRASGWSVEPAPQPNPGRAQCQVDTPVRLSALRDAEAASGVVQLPDKPVIACRFAEIFGGWLSGVVVPVMNARLGSPVAALQTGPGTECRTRDRIEGARISAHATGLAIDVAALATADGKRYRVELSPQSARWAAGFGAIRTAACGWFLTVLGPGSDAYHTDHLHLDLQRHGSSERYRICQ